MIEPKEQNQINHREIDFRVFMAETIVYRIDQSNNINELKKDVKEIKELLRRLPCDKRAYIPEQVRAIWICLAGVATAIICEWIKKGFGRG